MRDFFIILTIVSAARSFPLPIAEGDLDFFSPDSGLYTGSDPGLYTESDPGLDPYNIGLDDSSQSFFLASSDTNKPKDKQPSSASSGPTIDYDNAWSVTGPGGDTSWTGRDRNGGTGDWPVTIPSTSAITVNSDVNGPTSFELSPDQVTALIGAGSLVVGGVTWAYNSATGIINILSEPFGGLSLPSP